LIKQKQEKAQRVSDEKPFVSESRKLMSKLFALSGRDALNKILDQDDPGRLIQNLSRTDFFWILKKIGETDSLPLLQLASFDQWQYILDLELWEKDTFRINKSFTWLHMLQQADPARLVRWLISDGQALAHYFFFRTIQVVIREGDEVYDLPEDFFTLDDLYYIRTLDKEHETVIGNILRQLARDDYDRYQALLLGLSRLLPAETEEQMYRLRNVRLAEEGFLPWDEAISVYSPLKPDSLENHVPLQTPLLASAEESPALVPFLPFIHVTGKDLFVASLDRIADHSFLDRIRLEFSGLCNQLLSADSLTVNDVEDLISICRKAAGFINIGLETLSGDNMISSERFLKNNPLVSIFRVGFGLALELKWEAEQWIKEAWFVNQNLKPTFWDDEWGGILVGILQRRPLLYRGFQEGEAYKDFEQLSDVENCRINLHRLIILDGLLRILTERYPFDKERIKDPLLTFHPFLFNFWARLQLKLEPGFASLSLEHVRDFFRLLREKGQAPPYLMKGFKSVFIKDFMDYAADLKPEAAGLLKDTLSLVWEKFIEEHAWVATADLDGRFTKFLITRP